MKAWVAGNPRLELLPCSVLEDRRVLTGAIGSEACGESLLGWPRITPCSPLLQERGRWDGYVRCVRKPTARGVVGAFAVARIAIGAAFAVAPSRLTAAPAASDGHILMTRSFAIRELVLGVGGLVAIARADSRQTSLRLWAGLGALTDGGDLCASLAALRSDASATRVPTMVAAVGLLGELWAFRAAAPDRRARLAARPAG
jgi:hypothetical protein